MKMLLHLINKMSRILQPSIIFIDGAEKPFYKKVPKEEKQLEPKRLGKKLFKGIIKPILPEDRVLVLSITGKPWTARAKGLTKTYERVKLHVYFDKHNTYSNSFADNFNTPRRLRQYISLLARTSVALSWHR